LPQRKLEDGFHLRPKSDVESATNDSRPGVLIQIDSIDTWVPDTGGLLIEIAGRHPNATSGKGMRLWNQCVSPASLEARDAVASSRVL
jgi:hypothetical protein